MCGERVDAECECEEDCTKILKDVYLVHRKVMFSPLFGEILEEARRNDRKHPPPPRSGPGQ